MDDVQAAVLAKLAEFSDDDLESIADELTTFVARRRQAGTSGAAHGQFNASRFFENFLKLLKAIAPIIGPVIAGADTGAPKPA